jgi:nitrogen regulatory protein PII
MVLLRIEKTTGVDGRKPLYNARILYGTLATLQSAAAGHISCRLGAKMKLVEAYIPAEALYEIQDLLAELGIEDVVASEVAVEIAGDRQYWESDVTDFVPQLKLEMAVADDQAHSTAQQIFKAVGRRRERRRIQILIGRLEQVVRIETGERSFAGI